MSLLTHLTLSVMHIWCTQHKHIFGHEYLGEAHALTIKLFLLRLCSSIQIPFLLYITIANVGSCLFVYIKDFCYKEIHSKYQSHVYHSGVKLLYWKPFCVPHASILANNHGLPSSPWRCEWQDSQYLTLYARLCHQILPDTFNLVRRVMRRFCCFGQWWTVLSFLIPVGHEHIDIQSVSDTHVFVHKTRMCNMIGMVADHRRYIRFKLSGLILAGTCFWLTI